jgi:hypothetical protein
MSDDNNLDPSMLTDERAFSLKAELTGGREVIVQRHEKGFAYTFKRPDAKGEEGSDKVVSTLLLSEVASLAVAELILSWMYKKDPSSLTRIYQNVLANQNIMSDKTDTDNI